MSVETVMPPVHPGEILLEEFLRPLDVSQYQLAKELGVPARRINEIVRGSLRTLRCAWPATLAPPSGSG
jgi:antitoxin HigA-1